MSPTDHNNKQGRVRVKEEEEKRVVSDAYNNTENRIQTVRGSSSRSGPLSLQ